MPNRVVLGACSRQNDRKRTRHPGCVREFYVLFVTTLVFGYVRIFFVTTLISNVTEAVMEEVKTWQNRPSDEVYPILYMDALRVKVRDGAHIRNQAIHVAIAVNLQGNKEVLGLWAAQNEGAKFWLQVLTELQNRGVKDIVIACVDGLKGFPEVIESVYPKAEVQTCIVHMIRASLSYVNWKQRKQVAVDLRQIYRAATAAEAQVELDAFSGKWDAVYPVVSQTWRRHWDRITPFFAYLAEIRRLIYTTNAVESLPTSLRKIIKMRGSFPNEEAALKLLYLALRNAAKKWTRPLQDWRAALNRFSILWPDRMPAEERA